MTLLQNILATAALLQFVYLIALTINATRQMNIRLAMPPGCEAVARSFYQEILEIPEIVMPPKVTVRGGCWFESFEGMTIYLGPKADFRPRRTHLGLTVSGFEELCGRLRAHGYEVRVEPVRRGARIAFVEDPFGNRIKLIDAGY